MLNFLELNIKVPSCLRALRQKSWHYNAISFKAKDIESHSLLDLKLINHICVCTEAFTA